MKHNLYTYMHSMVLQYYWVFYHSENAPNGSPHGVISSEKAYGWYWLLAKAQSPHSETLAQPKSGISCQTRWRESVSGAPSASAVFHASGSLSLSQNAGS